MVQRRRREVARDYQQGDYVEPDFEEDGGSGDGGRLRRHRPVLVGGVGVVTLCRAV